MARLSRLAAVSGLALFSSFVYSYPQLQHEFKRRQINATQAKDSYDYIVVGGGQSGLVVANRLSEDPNVTVLIVEYGYFDNREAQIQPSSAVRYPPQDLYNLSSVPQTGLEGSKQSVYSACVVGGGSTINGMMLNRGAADDYDNWERLNNTGWGWHGMLPYFIKSTTFQAPSPTLQKEFNITWSDSSYGRDGPIHVSYAPYQWSGVKIQYKAMVEAGAEPQLDGADGRAFGVFWFTSGVDNTTLTRSYARSGYYDPVKDRKNLQILTGWRVNEVLFDNNKRATSIIMQERGTDANTTKTIVKARKEIVLTAGSLHSPQILQRSGIGPPGLLKEAGIEILVDLPGVGSNLQDHPVGHVSFNYTTDVLPNPTDSRSNETFQEWAQNEWKEHRGGPQSQTVGNTAGLLPLKLIAPERWQDIVDGYKAQDPKKYLPSTYNEQQVAGYAAQRAILADSMTRTDNAVVEFPLQGGGSPPLVFTKESSRGTILLDPKNVYAEPSVDYNTLVNPTDARIAAETIRFVRRFHAMPSIKVLGPVEQTPGAELRTDDELLGAVRRSTSSTTAHLSGTNSMMPRELAGVVDPQLRVYGVTGLSVADSSIMPLIPGAHICATVYAVAEKAADIIKARNKAK